MSVTHQYMNNVQHVPSSSAKLKRQQKLIADCIRSEMPLHDALKGIGWTYDDLLYEISDQPKLTNSNYFKLSDFANQPNNVPVVSFFSGAGGLDLGFEAAGFTHTALIEKVELFCSTLRYNRPSWKVLGPPDFSGDVSDTESIISELNPIIGIAPFNGVFIGGPPCQSFSIAANQRFSKLGDNFKRTGFAHEINGNLLFNFLDIIKHFRPAVFLIENVPGLLEVDGGEQLQRAYKEMEDVGYTMHEPIALLAAEHCVPQNRTRLFVVGNRLGKEFLPPKPTGKQLSCDGALALSLDGIENHITRNHSADSIKRYMMLDYGCRDKLGRVDRLNPALPSKTVIAGGTAGGGRSHLHPYIPRTLSARESARIQTFPDDYVFIGSSARQFTQVGNAVPPVLAAQLATALFSSFFQKA